MIPRLKKQFRSELKSTVMDQLNLVNVNEIPTLEKIVINIKCNLEEIIGAEMIEFARRMFACSRSLYCQGSPLSSLQPSASHE